MELIEAYKRIPYTDDEVRIYEITGRTKKRVEKITDQGKIQSRLHVAKVYSVLVAATSVYQALDHLREHRPEFSPNHAHCCGVMYLHHRYPFPLA